MPFQKPSLGYQPLSLKGRRDFLLPDDIALTAKTPDEYLTLALDAVAEAELGSLAFVMPDHLVALQEKVPWKESALGAAAIGAVVSREKAGASSESEPEDTLSASQSRRGFLRGAAGVVGAVSAFLVLGKAIPRSAAALSSVCDCYIGQFTNRTCDRRYRCYQNGPFGRQAVFDTYADRVGCSSPCRYVFVAYRCC